jgi:uncharacterized membrane protein YoaK (UPF0700 family)
LKDVGRFLLGLLLTAAAGWTDAVGLLEFGGFAASYMSGNTTQLGLAGATAEVPHAVRALSAILPFAFGAFVGGLMFAKGDRWTFALAVMVVAVSLCLAAGLTLGPDAPTPLALAPVAFAMGLQNHIVSKTRTDNAGTTFITGTLFRFGDALAQAALGVDRSARALRLLVVVTAFGIGGWCGAVATLREGARALVLPAGTMLALAVGALLLEAVRALRQRGRQRPAT